MATKKKTKKTAPRKRIAAKTKADQINAAVQALAASVTAEKAKKSRGTPSMKTSALDAAAKVLGDAKTPMTTRQMIVTMAAQNLWKSAHGKTPERTLYSAILREIVTKKKEARFVKTERGKFSLRKEK
jgi:hypothetical protein